MVRAVLWSLQRAIKILLSRTPFALPHPNLPRKEGGTKNAVFIAAWLAEFQNCTDYWTKDNKKERISSLLS